MSFRSPSHEGGTRTIRRTPARSIWKSRVSLRIWYGFCASAARPAGHGRAGLSAAQRCTCESTISMRISLGAELPRSLEPEILVRRRVREALDVVHARLFHPRAHTPEEGQFVDGHVHHPVLHDLLDLVQHALALLAVQLPGLPVEERLDLRDHPR